LNTTHGPIATPVFMPVGTLATVKSLTPSDLARASAQCLLANTYHLTLRPGAELVAQLGGLHRLMGWNRPILTDSGGFQVHSLASLRRTCEQGVQFQSHLDGSQHELTPENVVRTQELLGSDLTMPLDVCLGPEADVEEARAAHERTRRWADRSLRAHRRPDQQLFGIVQGGMHEDLRRQAARDMRSLDFPGFAIGGLSVGEPERTTARLLQAVTAELPTDRPRYLMGVGTPEQVFAYAGLGVDMFDCVLPTRLGRTGVAFTGFARLNLRRIEHRADPRPLDEACDCQTCAHYSRAFLHDAVRQRSPLGARLLSIHNVRQLVSTAERARAAILDGSFAVHALAVEAILRAAGEVKAAARLRSAILTAGRSSA
jgi:queuine tRNA-ribosyltransferase